MSITERIAARIQRLLTTPGEELGRWGRLLRFQVQLGHFCLRRLRENNSLAMSSALSFRTIFALIPVLVLSVVVMKSVGLAEQGKQGLRDLLTESGFSQIRREAPDRPGQAPPTVTDTTEAPGPDEMDEALPDEEGVRRRGGRRRSTNVAEQIERLVERAEKKLTLKRVGPVGVVVLIWSALTLLTTMERSLNRIFSAPRSRALGRRVLLYWSAVTLGPVAIAAAVYSGNKVAEAVADVPGVSLLLGFIGWAGPVLLGVALLAALYKLMPNTKVKTRAAVGGAAVAVVLWMLARWGFALYVSRLVGKDHFYGNLGLLPLFLMWLNLLWLVFLFGAELAHTAANLASLSSAELAAKTVVGPGELLATALAVARPFAAGDGAVPFEKISETVNLPDESLQQVLDRLAAGQVLCPVEGASGGEASYVLARPAEAITLTEVLDLAPDNMAAVPPSADEATARAIARARKAAGDALGQVSLADVAKDAK